jgi:bifunctional non-homologous end joining protein LigD
MTAPPSGQSRGESSRAQSSGSSSGPGGLEEYGRRRNFAATSEPEPEPEPEPQRAVGAAGDLPRFVVHEHHARRLHWDLRLEHDGALASWAVPNGIPDDPKRNRKAVHVEDHPLEYIDFAGTIPAGNYGAGEVSVWDTGTYTCEKWRADEVIVVFHGERLTGRYALFHAGREPRDWMIHRMDPAADPEAEEMPEFVAPMLAGSAEIPRDESKWAFEVKWDGVRAIAHSEPGRIHLLSRTGNEITSGYPELRALNRELGSRRAILDGEIVAFDEHGRPSFQALQSRMHVRGETAVRRLSQSVPATYLIFDLLWLDGHSLTGLPYTDRRELLEALDLDGPHWSVPESHRGQGAALLAATREQGLEGVVGKRLDSRYEPGRRSPAWIKLKNFSRQEFVIGGWTTGTGSRAQAFGALHLGVYADGELRYVGRVGTGFDQRELARLGELLEPLARNTTPFAGRQPAKGAHFVEPELVCEVEFSEWTHTGTLRQPSYKGLRDDKPAAEVVRERTVREPSVGEPPGSERPVAAAPRAPSAGKDQSPDIDALIAAGRKVRGGLEIELEGRVLKLTNLDKLLYPEAGFTKADLIRYYASVADVLLPHLHDRPLTLKRYPDGVSGEYFYEKRSPRHRPDWVQTTSVLSERGRGEIDYTLCQDLPTLVWLANLADIELHPFLSRASAVSRPTVLVFDLDPGAPATIVECCQVALELRDLFAELGLSAYPKTSGSKGMQIYVPLNDPEVDYEQTKTFAHAVATLLEQRHPGLVVSAMAKDQRDGKVLIDWSQNDEHKTTVGVYSLRAMGMPTVSTPLAWDEVSACLQQRRPELLWFRADEVVSRIVQSGDLFCDVLSVRQILPCLEN